MFERADEQNVLEDSTGETERISARGFTKMFGETENELFEDVLRAAGERGAQRALDWRLGTRQAEFAVKAGRENAGAVRAGREIFAIQDRQALCAPSEKFPECVAEVRLAVLAEPLQFVFVMLRTEADQLSHAGIKPTNRTEKGNRMEWLDRIVFTERDQASGAMGAKIESEDERSRKVRGVEGAGRVAKMMIEKRKAASGEKLAKMRERRLVSRILAAILL